MVNCVWNVMSYELSVHWNVMSYEPSVHIADSEHGLLVKCAWHWVSYELILKGASVRIWNNREWRRWLSLAMNWTDVVIMGLDSMEVECDADDLPRWMFSPSLPFFIIFLIFYWTVIIIADSHPLQNESCDEGRWCEITTWNESRSPV